MKIDVYKTVNNSKENYKDIATAVNLFGNCIVAWRDGHGTQLDVLFTKLMSPPFQSFGSLQNGISPDYLFVSLMRVGSFGFNIYSKDTFPSYYAEKLFLPSTGPTAQELTKLINGVKAELRKLLKLKKKEVN